MGPMLAAGNGSQPSEMHAPDGWCGVTYDAATGRELPMASPRQSSCVANAVRQIRMRERAGQDGERLSPSRRLLTQPS